MACIELKNLSFTYPNKEVPAISGINLAIEEGEFVMLIGPSGGGKTTLLRALKPILAPHGTRTGTIGFLGKPLESLDRREQAAQIGFVLQKPEHQVVTDKVWHEMAFGLESLGASPEVIRRRVAEMAAFFGIEEWFYKNVCELSGGQKQLLNLAAVMTMQPRVLLLDEPTAQLDPIATADFLAALSRIRRELGTTVILSEHSIEDALPLCDRVIALDKTVIASGTPEEVCGSLRDTRHRLYSSMPLSMRLCGKLTTPEARMWLEARQEPLLPVAPKLRRPAEETVIELKNVTFRYEKEGPDILRDFSCRFGRGQITALLGGNGSGKTTTLSLLANLRKPQRGKRLFRGKRMGLLPQDPQMLFVCESVAEELVEALEKKDREEARLDAVVSFCRLEGLMKSHPYDLSGGEQQRVALAKVLLTGADVLLLDEPTKGMDAGFKRSMGDLLRSLAEQGKTIILVSHDVQFCAAYADRCLLMFDGGIVAQGTPEEFFSGNSFYTTPANRIARRKAPHIVTEEELLTACGVEALDFPADDDDGTREGFVQSATKERAPLPLWRVLPAIGLLIGALGILMHLFGPYRLSFLLGLSTPTVGLLLAGILVAMWVCVARRSVKVVLNPGEEKRRRRRNRIAVLVVLILVPATILAGVYLLEDRNYMLISLLVLLEIMAPFALLFEKRAPSPRELVLLAVLIALAVAGRTAFYALPNCKPVAALVIVSGVALGGESGFLVGAMTMLLSNIMFGQGPWTPWQMFGMGMVGFLAGVLYRQGLLRRDRLSLCIFGAIMVLGVYGPVGNLSSAITWQPNLTWKVVMTYMAGGFLVDVTHAVATVIFLWLFGEPMLKKMDRIKGKYGMLQ